MADRTLNVKITGDTAGLGRAFNKASRDSKTFGSSLDKHASGALHELARAAKYAALGVGVGFAGALVYSIKRAQESQRVHAQTAAVLKSTGGAANISAKQVQSLATRLSRLSGIDDETVQSTENLLLTFRDIRNEAGKGNKIFDQATIAVQNMSVALGEDGKSAAIQLGKALQDPIKGITSLRRVGVGFSDAQTKLIKHLVETGHKMQAQKLILGELRKEFGGSARAAGNTFAGQLSKAKVELDNVAEAIGGILLPILTSALRSLNRWVIELQNSKRAHADLKQALDLVKTAIEDGIKIIGEAIGFYQKWAVWIQAAAVALGVLVVGVYAYVAAMKISALWTKIQAGEFVILNAVMDANPFIIVIAAAAALAAGFVVLWRRSQTFRDIVRGSIHAVQVAFDAVIGFIRQHWQTMLAVMTSGVSVAVIFIVNHWQTIKTGFNHMVHFIVDRWNDVAAAFRKFIGWVNKYIIGPIKTAISWARKLLGILTSLPGSGSGAGTPGRGGSGSAGQAQRYAASRLGAYGWDSSQMSPLVSLWNRESGWSPFAVNPSSNAQGIPQLLPSAHPGAHPGFPSWPPVSFKPQVDWGLGYIKGAYGSPARAWAHETTAGWYDQGGVVPGPRGVHRPIMAAGGETILPTHKSGGVTVVLQLNGRELARGVVGELQNHARSGGLIPLRTVWQSQ